MRTRVHGMLPVAALALLAAAGTPEPAPHLVENPSMVSPTDGARYRAFGAAVDIDGDAMVVGAPCDASTGWPGQRCDGAAYVYTRAASGWVEEAKIVPADRGRGDEFGTAVAVSGDTIVVGAYHAKVGTAERTGAAYVFSRSGSTWTQEAKLTQRAPDAYDDFGRSVGIEGDTVVVGANHDEVGSKFRAGSAWVFVRTGTSWALDARLTAPDGEEHNEFGTSVAIDGRTIVVGSPGAGSELHPYQGAVYAFHRSDRGWRFQAKMLAVKGDDSSGLGESVGLDGDTAVGATNEPGVRQEKGYVFVRAGRSWTEQAVLDVAAAGSPAGASVDVSGDVVVLGDGHDDIAGAAYVFSRSNGTWDDGRQLLPADPAGDQRFGRDVAADAGLVAVGRPGPYIHSLRTGARGAAAPDGAPPEAVFLYRR